MRKLPLLRPLLRPIISRGSSTTGKGGAGAIDSILGAGGADYGWLDFKRIAGLYQDNAGSTPITMIGQTIGRINATRKAPHNSQQTTSGSRPLYQANGSKYNGVAENLISDWLAKVGENCLFVRATIPATVSATQCILGTQDTGVINRMWLGVDTIGRPYFGLGGTAFQIAGYDIRNKEIVFGLACDGANVRVFLDGVQIYTAAQVGSPSTTTAARLGAASIGPSATNFFAGTITEALFGLKYVSEAEAARITAQLLAA